MDQSCQLEGLIRQLNKLLVLGVLFLGHLPLQIRGRLAFEVGPVLADHHGGRPGDCLERHDHRQQAKGIALARTRGAPGDQWWCLTWLTVAMSNRGRVAAAVNPLQVSSWPTEPRVRRWPRRRSPDGQAAAAGRTAGGAGPTRTAPRRPA